METQICVDTDILADFLRNKPEAVEWIKVNEKKNVLATTIINLFELYYGAYKSAFTKQNLPAVKALAQRLLILNLTDEIVRAAGERLAQLESNGQHIDFRDVLIGTTALVEKCAIKPRNIKHFSRIDGLTLA